MSLQRSRGDSLPDARTAGSGSSPAKMSAVASARCATGRRERIITSEPSPHHKQIEEDVHEIFDVLRRREPERPTLELWDEALTLYRVRFATEILPPAEQDD